MTPTEDRPLRRRGALPYLAAALLAFTAAGPAIVNAEEPTARGLLEEASRHAVAGDSRAAVQQATLAIEKDGRLAGAYYLRGRERFRLGKIKEALADFDRYVELAPQLEPRQWERGIACYYAGQYEKGARQFELYQTYHDNDVENSVWRFLCMAPDVGVAKARSVMLPIRNDRRVPMMQIFEMFRGKLTPEEVLKAARSGEPTPAELAGRLFYAHLYLGLYYEATGNQELAGKYIRLAADPDLAKNPRINRYMWDVARIHASRLPPEQPSP